MKVERRFKPAESGRKSIKQVQLIPDDSVDISDALREAHKAITHVDE